MIVRCVQHESDMHNAMPNKQMRKKFGNEWSDFCRRVKRFILI